MATLQRSDVHRPSVINPEDYAFVAVSYQKCESMDDVYAIAYNREILAKHMAATGAVYSQHAHGGNCHVCGAACIYTAVFHHLPTNTYIRTGFDCAEKLDMGDERVFRGFKKSIQDARERMAGKAKAEAILVDLGLSQAWEICKAKENDGSYEVNTIRDIVAKLVRYGNLSEKQEAFIGKLLNQINNREAIEAARKAEHDAAADVPTGKATIRGEVISTKVQDGFYGVEYKMVVKDERGFKVFGSIPSSLQLIEETVKEYLPQSEVRYFEEQGRENQLKQDEKGIYLEYPQQRGLQRGDKVEFSANVEPSKDDAKFGFYKRPTKAKLIS